MQIYKSRCILRYYNLKTRNFKIIHIEIKVLKRFNNEKQTKNQVQKWTQVFMRYLGYLSLKCCSIRLKFNKLQCNKHPLILRIISQDHKMLEQWWTLSSFNQSNSSLSQCVCGALYFMNDTPFYRKIWESFLESHFNLNTMNTLQLTYVNLSNETPS